MISQITTPEPSAWLDYGFAGCIALILVSVLGFCGWWIPRQMKLFNDLVQYTAEKLREAHAECESKLIEFSESSQQRVEALMEREHEHSQEIVKHVADRIASELERFVNKMSGGSAG